MLSPLWEIEKTHGCTFYKQCSRVTTSEKTDMLKPLLYTMRPLPGSAWRITVSTKKSNYHLAFFFLLSAISSSCVPWHLPFQKPHKSSTFCFILCDLWLWHSVTTVTMKAPEKDIINIFILTMIDMTTFMWKPEIIITPQLYVFKPCLVNCFGFPLFDSGSCFQHKKTNTKKTHCTLHTQHQTAGGQS